MVSVVIDTNRPRSKTAWLDACAGNAGTPFLISRSQTMQFKSFAIFGFWQRQESVFH